MGHSDEPKMDDLKRLLRRLDGLDGSKGLAKTAETPDEDQRGYVGALRGTPIVEDEAHGVPAKAVTEEKSGSTAVYLAAATAAVISTATVYLIMSWPDDAGVRGSRSAPAAERAVPSKVETLAPPASGAPGQRESTDTVDGMVRQAELMLQEGKIEAARELLQQAAEKGSGPAALKLGRSYDPARSGPINYADSETNAALAQAWYERALSLGTQEAAAYISDPSVR